MSSQVMVDRVTMSAYDVDADCRLYTADGKTVLSKVFGAGMAYPQRRSDGMQLPVKDLRFDITFYKYPRVDSFDLYRNYAAVLILKKVCPATRLLGHISHRKTPNPDIITNA